MGHPSGTNTISLSVACSDGRYYGRSQAGDRRFGSSNNLLSNLTVAQTIATGGGRYASSSRTLANLTVSSSGIVTGAGGLITPSSYWSFYGDSQTAGPVDTPAGLPTKSHATAFRAIWEDNFTSPASVNIDGVGSVGLAAHRTRYDADTHNITEWCHIQESGDQNEPGQTTREAWGDTFESFIRFIKENNAPNGSQNGLISYETAYSFELRGVESDPYRDWTTYNEELRERIAVLQSTYGHTVHLVDTDTYIKRLVTALNYQTVCQVNTGTAPEQTPAPYTKSNAPRHFTEVGNLCVALGIFKTFGYDIRTLDLSSVTGTTIGFVSAAHVAACIEAVDPVVVQTFAHGEEFTLAYPGTGPTFGTFDGQILAYLDPESYTNGISFHNITPTLTDVGETITQSTGQGARMHCRVANTRAAITGGTKAVFLDWDHADNTGSQTINAFGFTSAGFGNRVFLHFDKYMEGNYGPVGNHKDVYIYGTYNDGASLQDMPQFLSLINANATAWGTYNNNGGDGVTLQWRYHDGIDDGNSAPGSDASRERTYEGTRDQWFSRTMWGIKNTVSGVANGTARMYYNGQLVLDMDGNYMHARSAAIPDDAQWADIRTGHMCQGFVDSAQAWFGSWYAASTAARVVVTTESTYVLSAERIIAIQPRITWTPTSITFLCNQGRLPLTGPLYAHIFDNDDNYIRAIQIRS